MKTRDAVLFDDGTRMYEALMNDNAFYNEEDCIYAFRYSESDSICIYHLSNEYARKISDEATAKDECWEAFLGPGGQIIDDQDEVQVWCTEHYNVGKWMLVI